MKIPHNIFLDILIDGTYELGDPIVSLHQKDSNSKRALRIYKLC